MKKVDSRVMSFSSSDQASQEAPVCITANNLYSLPHYRIPVPRKSQRPTRIVGDVLGVVRTGHVKMTGFTNLQAVSPAVQREYFSSSDDMPS